jgi:hypothetical protein
LLDRRIEAYLEEQRRSRHHRVPWAGRLRARRGGLGCKPLLILVEDGLEEVALVLEVMTRPEQPPGALEMGILGNSIPTERELPLALA